MSIIGYGPRNKNKGGSCAPLPAGGTQETDHCPLFPCGGISPGWVVRYSQVLLGELEELDIHFGTRPPTEWLALCSQFLYLTAGPENTFLGGWEDFGDISSIYYRWEISFLE